MAIFLSLSGNFYAVEQLVALLTPLINTWDYEAGERS